MSCTRTLLPPVILLMLVVMAAPLQPVGAQTPAPGDRITVERFLDWERVADPQISPDGGQVLFTRSTVNKLKDRWDSEIWLMNSDGSRKRFLVDGSTPRWSVDGFWRLRADPRLPPDLATSLPASLIR